MDTEDIISLKQMKKFNLKGAATLRITTLVLMTLSVMSLSMMAISIMTFSTRMLIIMTLGIPIKNETQHTTLTITIAPLIIATHTEKIQS